MTPQWPHNSFTKRFHLDFPLLLAPMAGFTTPELVSSISCAGGLGSLGAAHMSPKELRSAIEALRLKTHKPFIVNLYAASPTAASEQSIKAQVALNPYRKKLGLPGRFECLRPAYTFEDQLDVLIEEKIPIFSFSLGCISKSQRQRLEKAGIAVFGTATQLKEVKHLNQLRVDAIILQGEEAGGPRSTFLTPCREGLVSLLDLIPQAKEVSSLPLIAAGGIIHAKQIAAALILGADAVQMGTAFAICAESGAPACFKEAFKKYMAKPTVLTEAYNGRLSRVIQTDFLKTLEKLPNAGFPDQIHILSDLQTKCLSLPSIDFTPLFAGEGFSQASDRSALEIFYDLAQCTSLIFKELRQTKSS